MPNIINASITNNGLVYSADASGVLQLQSNGVTGLTVESTANVTVNTNLNVTGNVTSSRGTVTALVSETAKVTTSGTSVEFTGIPSWVRRITLMFNGVSTNGTSNMLVQFGTSSGYVVTGYVSGSAFVLGATTYTNQQYTTGFGIRGATAANAISGALTFFLMTGNTWVESGTLNTTQDATFMNAGIIALAATLDRLRLTTVNGTDAFDAGSINIMYE